MNKEISLNYPVKVWITTIVLSSFLIFLDVIYLSEGRVKIFIIEDVYTWLLILFGLFTYSLPIVIVVYILMIGFRKVIRNELKLKILLISFAASSTILIFYIFGYGINLASILCVVIEILAGMCYRIYGLKKPKVEIAK